MCGEYTLLQACKLQIRDTVGQYRTVPFKGKHIFILYGYMHRQRPLSPLRENNAISVRLCLCVTTVSWRLKERRDRCVIVYV